MMERGQSSKKIERAFLSCFRHYELEKKGTILEEYSPGIRLFSMNETNLKRKINYNETPDKYYH